MEKKVNIAIVFAVVAIVLAGLGMFGVVNQPVVKGTTDFDTVRVDDMLVDREMIVYGTSTLSGTTAMSGTVTAVNLVSSGDLWVTGNSILTGTAQVGGNVWSQTGAFTITDALVVTSTADVAGTFQYGASNLYPLGYQTWNGRSYGNIATTVTNTMVLSTTHGCQNGITTALCMVAVPAAGAGDPFICEYTVSNMDVTFQALQDDANDATNTGNLHYWIVGW